MTGNSKGEQKRGQKIHIDDFPFNIKYLREVSGGGNDSGAQLSPEPAASIAHLRELLSNVFQLIGRDRDAGWWPSSE